MLYEYSGLVPAGSMFLLCYFSGPWRYHIGVPRGWRKALCYIHGQVGHDCMNAGLETMPGNLQEGAEGEASLIDQHKSKQS